MMPPTQNTSVKVKANKSDWTNDERFAAALDEWNTNPPQTSKGKRIPVSRFYREHCIPYRAFQWHTTHADISEEKKTALLAKRSEGGKKRRAGMSEEAKKAAQTKHKQEKK